MKQYHGSFKNSLALFKRKLFEVRLRKMKLGQRVILGLLSIFILLFLGSFLAKPRNDVNTISSLFVSGMNVISGRSNSDVSGFKNVENFFVPDSTKTVYYIPQIHREPTTNASDSKNDQAVLVQKEIFSMLNTLVDNKNAKLVMDETDLYGSMPVDKVNKMKSGLTNVENAKRSLTELLSSYLKNGGSESTARSIESSANTEIAKYERNLYLTGGAAVLAASNSNAFVYGSQNASTIAEAKTKLQNIVYLENRINTLEGKNTSTSQNSAVSTQSLDITNLINLLGGQTGTTSFASVKSFALKSSNTELLDKVKGAEDSFKALINNPSFETDTNTSSNSNVDSSNPYNNSTNLTQLKAKFDVDYADFLKLAKDQRSQEVCDNLEKAMNEKGVDSSVLVFGAQHKDQLISMFNKKGISVVAITPESEKAVQPS